MDSFLTESPSISSEKLSGLLETQLASFGITRVGDLTGLDAIGIPVFFACRPNSRSLSVCQGKALSPERARLGAIMECIEQAIAERGEDCVDFRASRIEMRMRGLRCIDEMSLSRCTALTLDEGKPRAWVTGCSIVTGEDVYVPFELVGLDMRCYTDWDRQAYRMSSIGMGAAASRPEAALHALLELIENDATAPIEFLGLQSGLARPLQHRVGHHAELDLAVAKVEAAGLQCTFVDLTAREHLPVIGAFLYPHVAGPTMLGGRLFAGFACRVCPQEAALAALMEAVQSRLTQISGAREDISPDQYIPRDPTLRSLSGQSSFIDVLAASASRLAGRPHETLRWVIDATLQSGVDDIVFVALGDERTGVSVVRAFATGLQAYARDGIVQLGAHVLDRLSTNQRTPQ